MHRISVVIALVCLSAAAFAQKVEFTSSPRTGEDVLIEISLQLKGEMTVGSRRLTLNSKDTIKAVDRITTVDQDGVVATRLYLKSESTGKGQISDPPLAGLEFEYSVGDNLHCDVEKAGKTYISPSLLAREEAKGAGLTGRLPWPESLEVGQSTELDMRGLFADLTGLSAIPEKAVAKLTLENINDKKKTASLSGPWNATLKEDPDKHIPEAELEGRCSIVWDLKNKRPTRITLNVTANTRTKEGATKTQGVLQIKCTWKSKVGRAATKARKAKLRFRNVPRSLKKIGLAVELPSHFQKASKFLTLGEEMEGFASGLNGIMRMRRISFGRLTSSGDPKVAVKQGLIALRKKYPGSKSSKIKTAIGQGESLTMEEDGFYIVQDYIATKKGVVLAFYSFHKSDKKAAQGEVKLVRKTLKFLR